MKWIICLLFLVIFQLPIYGQEFNLLRQNDDLTALDSTENGYQRLKKMNLSKHTVLSMGGSWRFQAESFINDQFDRQAPQDNLWFLNRLMAHAHLKVGDHLELFSEIGSSLVTGKEFFTPVDKNELYVSQLFAKYRFAAHWDVAAGRQNLRLGSGRLVDIREGPNVRRSFDFGEINYHSQTFRAKTFFSIPVQSRPYVLDDKSLQFDETFSGIYATINRSTAQNFDVYLLYQKDNDAKYNNGVEDERRASVGLRHFGKYKDFIYNNEVVYQFGRFGQQTISAYTVSFNVERETRLWGRDFNLGFKTEAISGDKDANDNKMGTFDALYPRGAYFGRVARFGPSNLIDIHPSISTTFNKWQVEFDYDAFWRYSLQDGVYGAAMTLDYPSVNNQRFIAHQMGTILSYRYNKFVAFAFESSLIIPGKFLQYSNKGDDLYHFIFTSEIKF